MKTTIVSKEVNEEIDWSKPQWVIWEEKESRILFTNGNHSEHVFEGYCLPDTICLNGEFSKCWDKEKFKPIPKDGLTIHIQND